MQRPLRLALIVLALSVAPAAAQEPPPGTNAVLSARDYVPLPAGAAVTVVALDDTDRNLRIKEVIEGALRTRGYTVADDAPLILEFEVREVVGSSVAEEGGGIVQFRSRIGGRFGGDEQRVRVSVFSTSRDSLLTGRRSARRDDGRPRTTRRLHIDMVVNRAEGRQRLWEGRAAADLGRGDVLVTARALAPRLVDALGETAGPRFFSVP